MCSLVPSSAVGHPAQWSSLVNCCWHYWQWSSADGRGLAVGKRSYGVLLWPHLSACIHTQACSLLCILAWRSLLEWAFCFHCWKCGHDLVWPSPSASSFARLLEFSFSSSLIELYLLSSPLTFHYDQNRPYYKDIQCTLGKCCSEYHNNFSCVCFSQQLVAILFHNLLSQSPASSHGSLPICSFWQSSHLFPCQDKFNRDPLVWICTFFSRGSGSRWTDNVVFVGGVSMANLAHVPLSS